MSMKVKIGIVALAAMHWWVSAEGSAIRSPDIADVTVTGGFWLPRLETNRAVTVQSDLKRCEETGRLANFRLAGKRAGGGFRGIPYDDSDVF